MSLEHILLIGTSAVTASVIVLRVVAPMTNSKKDDWVLSKLEWLLATVLVPSNYKRAKLGTLADGSSSGGKSGGPG
jgi:hypothetical protein